MEHKLILGGEVWLPFARSRIKSLKATGIRYGDQKFNMPDGATVWVKIEPGYEYIKIIGEDPISYLLWPTSDQNLDGVLVRNEESVDPHVGIGLNTASVRVELDCTRGALPQDWVSDDGGGKYGKHLITYDSGAMFRYQWANLMDTTNVAQPIMFADGVEVETAHGVRGACLAQPLVNGVKTPQIVYASTNTGYTSIYLHHFSPPPKDAVSFVADETDFHTYTPGGALYITQPVFFDGLGTKFVTVSETWNGAEFVEPRYRVRGAINVDNNGVYTLTVTTAALGMEADVSESIPDPPGWPVNYSQDVTANFLEEELIGLDMSITGQELLVTKRFAYSTHVVRDRTAATSGWPGIDYLHTIVGDSLVTQDGERSIRVNGEIINETEFSRVVHETIDFILVWNTTEHYAEDDRWYTITGDNAAFTYLGVRDVDARFGASLVLSASSSISYSLHTHDDITGRTIEDLIESYGDVIGVLKFIFDTELFSKQVFDSGDNGGFSPGINDARYYRMFASRRKDEFVANVALIGSAKGSINNPDPYADIADITPITVLKKGNVTHTITAKRLGLGQADTGVSFYPVLLLF